MPSYYSHPYVSNSDLSRLKRELESDVYVPPTASFRFGSLVDAVITEPLAINRETMKFVSDGIAFTKGELAKADRMRQLFLAHPICRMIYTKSTTQAEIYADYVPFHVDGVDFELPMRAKLDFFWADARIVADLKTTAAKTQQAFEHSAMQFDYYRQMVHYCKLTGSNRAAIIGMSKANDGLFPIFINEGDERWQIGERDLNTLALKYFLFHG